MEPRFSCYAIKCRAPEKLCQRKPGEKLELTLAADMWSFGISLIQLMESNPLAPYGAAAEVPNIVHQVCQETTVGHT